MPDVKRVVVYGIVHSDRDHHDYAAMGEWVFDLYDRLVLPKIEAPLVVRRTKKGRFAKHGGKVETRLQYRDPTTGRFVKPPTFFPRPPSAIPDDDTIVADVLRIVEEESGHRLYRTPSQQQAGLDRVKIGTQRVSLEDIKRTYTYDEFLKELRRRAKSEWRNR